MSDVGVLLRAHRTDRGMSMNSLARSADIDPAYVMRIEQGIQSSPSRDVVLALAKALNLPFAEGERFLYAAGHAPRRDWQAVADDYARRLRLIDRELVGLDILND